MSEGNFASGKCLCGNVRYSISAGPDRMGQCHCEDCRRTSGTGHISNAFFNINAVTIEGEAASYSTKADSGSTLTRFFCPNCGSRMFGKNSSKPDIISVTAGTLDNAEWFKPGFIVYNRDKPAWDFMDGSVPTFDEMPTA